mmetsp:Transcript_101086/g.179413  ORF Transcript_101086/g.179413 Transcript_101086/m.179413 type:complete len:112 (+) Transcript_101086:1409-1744(+)
MTAFLRSQGQNMQQCGIVRLLASWMNQNGRRPRLVRKKIVVMAMRMGVALTEIMAAVMEIMAAVTVVTAVVMELMAVLMVVMTAVMVLMVAVMEAVTKENALTDIENSTNP